MKKYEAYKPSGIDWIGDVPKDWGVIKLKYKTLSLKSGGTPSSGNESFYSEDGTPWVAIADMSNTDYVYDTDKKVTEEGIKDKSLTIYPEGTLLYSIYATLGKVSVLKVPATINQAILAIALKGDYNQSFLKYNFKAMENYVFSLSNGNTQYNLNAEKVANFFIVDCPLAEQTAIANYLDAKCAKIDTVVAVQQKRIELLKELKQSIITKAVTKGLDKNAKMKDSGVDWIGEVPEKWKEDKLRYIGKYRKGPFGSALKVSLFVPKSSNTIKVYEQQNAIEKNADIGEYYITQDYFNNELSAFEVLPRDIIVSCAGTIGECYLMPQKIERGIINQALMRMRMDEKKVYIPYFLMLFDVLLKEESKISSNGSAIKNIPPFDVLKSMRIFLPTISEQTALASYLDKKCATIDKQILKVEKQIELLNEYKQSVITECVTGKRKVC